MPPNDRCPHLPIEPAETEFGVSGCSRPVLSGCNSLCTVPDTCTTCGKLLMPPGPRCTRQRTVCGLCYNLQRKQYKKGKQCDARKKETGPATRHNIGKRPLEGTPAVLAKQKDSKTAPKRTKRAAGQCSPRPMQVHQPSPLAPCPLHSLLYVPGVVGPTDFTSSMH